MTLNRLLVPAISLLSVGGVAVASAPVIGVAFAQNGITLDNSRVSGDATLFAGSTVQSDGYSRIKLNNGTRLDLAAGSRAQVFGNSETLESGMSEVQSSSGFEIQARTLKIQPSDASSIMRVKLDGAQAVLVTALNSPVNVSNKDGFLVARVMPGVPFSFLPQAAAAKTGNEVDITGCVLQKGDSAVLVDQTGTQVYELHSAKKTKFDKTLIGSRDHVAGAIDPSATPDPKSGAKQVLIFGGIKLAEKGGCADIAAKVGASAVAAGAIAIPVAAAGTTATVAATAAVAAGVPLAAAGVSTALVVGGVAAAAAAGIGGAVAASSKSSTSN